MDISNRDIINKLAEMNEGNKEFIKVTNKDVFDKLTDISEDVIALKRNNAANYRSIKFIFMILTTLSLGMIYIALKS